METQTHGEPGSFRTNRKKVEKKSPKVLKDGEESVFISADAIMAKHFGVPIGTEVPAERITHDVSERLAAAYHAAEQEPPYQLDADDIEDVPEVNDRDVKLVA